MRILRSVVFMSNGADSFLMVGLTVDSALLPLRQQQSDIKSRPYHIETLQVTCAPRPCSGEYTTVSNSPHLSLTCSFTLELVSIP